MSTEPIEQSLPKALTAWYDFKAGSSVLFVLDGDKACGVICEDLREKGMTVSVLSEEMALQRGEQYDYIVAIGVIERRGQPVAMLTGLRSLLQPHGVLIVGAENRLGIRYFCGDKDIFSGHAFDGPEGYVQVNAQRMTAMKGRMYAWSELSDVLTKAGFTKKKCYAVMPSLTRPQLLISMDYQPNELLNVRIFPQYYSPETVFLEEEHLYQILMANHIFHQMANAYLIECPLDGKTSEYDQITVQGDRCRSEAMATLIIRGCEVKKKALYPESGEKPRTLMRQQTYLQEHGVPMIEGYVKDDAYIMPYVTGEIATQYFQNLLNEDRERFMQELQKFRAIILSSSEHVPYENVDWKRFEPHWEKRKKDDPNRDKWEKLAFGTKEQQANIGVILKRGYVDMVSLNCFHTKKGFLFFDQEFYIENFPANAIFYRTIDLIYMGRPDMEQIYAKDELLKYFGLYEHRELWQAKAREFLEKLRSEKELSVYHKKHRIDWNTMQSNRLRMNYPQDEYERLFTNIFRDIENKKIYLFGSGRYAERFLEQFGQYLTVSCILDNGESRWGQTLNGIPISTPEILKRETQPYKVFICIKQFDEVLAQLKEMGVKYYAVYNPSVEYERPVTIAAAPVEENTIPKPYHIGYVAGVFDLFHIGHLNLLRRAKEQCDYLIVGVVSDEQVIRNKKTSPCIPFVERIEIVRACRYVDEAVKIPVDRPDTENAWHMYHFDAQFSGSDYEDDPVWLGKKTFLQQHGADLVFFPYTKGTSSTKLKERIERN